MWQAWDDSKRYRIDVDPVRVGGFLAYWRWRVVDLGARGAVIDEDTAHRDADAWSEAWAIVSLLLAHNDAHLEGAYSIGVTQY